MDSVVEVQRLIRITTLPPVFSRNYYYPSNSSMNSSLITLSLTAAGPFRRDAGSGGAFAPAAQRAPGASGDASSPHQLLEQPPPRPCAGDLLTTRPYTQMISLRPGRGHVISSISLDQLLEPPRRPLRKDPLHPPYARAYQAPRNPSFAIRQALCACGTGVAVAATRRQQWWHRTR